MNQNPQSGVALVLAIMLMFGVLVIGIGALDVATFNESVHDGRYERLVAHAMAEGGIDLGYGKLEVDPTFRGKFTQASVDGTICTVEITDVAGGIEIVADVASSVTTSRKRAYLKTTSSPGPLRPMEIRNNLHVEYGTFTVDGEVIVGGKIDVRDGEGGVVVGPAAVGTLSAWSMSFSPAEATQTLSGLSAMIGPIRTFDSDVTLVNGPMVLTGPNVTLTGTFFVDGALSIGGVGSVKLGTPESPITLMVTGAVNALGDLDIEIHGSVFVDNSVWFDFVPTVTGSGILYTLGEGKLGTLYVHSSNLTWTFDPKASVPPWVTGIPVSTDALKYSEVWRQTESVSR